MKFLIDQQLPATLTNWFTQKGFDALHVRDLGMRNAPDTAIWQYALEHLTIIVTKDEDFAARRARTAGPQILWLRIGNATNIVLRSHLTTIWDDVERSLRSGEGVVETGGAGRTRRWRLGSGTSRPRR